MIEREITPELRACAGEYPVVTLLGPRQSGKTTLAQHVFPDKPYYSMESPDVRLRVQSDPRGFLNACPSGAVLDEIQNVPELLSYIQEVVDRRRTPGRFILTGSHQPRLHEAVSQSLAGRTALLTLMPLTFAEQTAKRRADPFALIANGSYPQIVAHGANSTRFFNNYIQTCLERDIRALIHLRDMRRFQQFLVLLAGRTGQLLNYGSVANDVGVSIPTVKDWISVLTASFLVFELPPYFENITKRVVKSSKLYFTEPAQAAHLLGLTTPDLVSRDPLRGGLYENLMITDLLRSRANLGRRPELYFYRDAKGNEVDLVIRARGNLFPVEIKSSQTFHPDFHRGIASFSKAAGHAVQAGAILCDIDQPLTFKNASVFNPLKIAWPESMLT